MNFRLQNVVQSLRTNYRESCQILAPILFLMTFVGPVGVIGMATSFSGLENPEPSDVQVMSLVGMLMFFASPLTFCVSIFFFYVGYFGRKSRPDGTEPLDHLSSSS